MSLFKQLWVHGLMLGAAVLLTCACASTDGDQENASMASAFGADAPDWVMTGKVRGLLNATHIIGLGYSARDLPEVDAYDHAKLEAFTDISTQVETFVSNEFTAIQRSVFHNEDVNESVDYKSVSRQVTKELLAGVEVVRRYYSQETGAACVVAALDREKFGRRLLKQVEDARTAADGHWNAFTQTRAADNPSESMKSLVLAHGSMDTVIDAHLKAIAVRVPSSIQGGIAALNDPALMAKITEELSTFTNRVRILAVAGNEQKAMLTGLLKEPVKVEIRLGLDSGPIPLEAFPVHVTVESAEKAKIIPHGETTDSSGCFSFDLTELKATGAASNTVTVQLDFRSIHKKCSFEGPALDVIYFMPTRDTTRIGVIIHETIDGKSNPNSFTASAIKEVLTDLGFQVIRTDTSEEPGQIVALPQSELFSRFSPACDYLIAGTAEAEHSSDDGKIEWYFTRLVIDALELDTAKTIHFEVPMGQSTKGGDKNRNKAWRASLTKAAAIIVGDPKHGDLGLLAKKFVARFDEGSDWSE